MKKKWLASSIIAVTMLASLLAGCSSGEKPNNTNTPATSKPQESNPPAEEQLTGHLITKDPLELKIHLHYADKFIFDDEWPVFKKAAELTNIKLKGTASKASTNSKEMFNVMMVSGSLPDIVHHQTKEQYDSYGMEGAFLALDDLIEEHAPNIKKHFEENPNAAKFAKAPDGKIYFINFTPDGPAAKGWFIRQDWLDKLELKAPTTVDELYEVLKAFKEKDPNGNNKADEVPFLSRANMDGIYDLISLWGASGGSDGTKRGFFAENGVVKYGMYEPAYKTAVENIAKWYAEGLIDKEIFTRGAKARDILFGDNTGGVVHDWFSSTAVYNDKLASQVEGFNLVPIAPPANSNGVIIEASSRKLTHPNGWGIASSSKHPVEAIKYLDFWFSEDGRKLMNFGIEGKHYEMVDGKPKFKDEVLNNEKSVIQQLQEEGGQLEIGFHQDYEYEKQWTNEIALKGIEEYVGKGYIQEAYPSVTYTEEERTKFQELNVAVNTYADEMLQKWVLGAEPINDDNFAKYLKRLDALGIKELLELEQRAYDRYMAN
ncbi:extracellular solute-binding protein [Paenibacillus sp. GXUN7292]|uniref:extracellular solute-binding protein n=1 Tax=Paenibacillus sp. GXUN7292 TaxID=3422499 RepID=UPI003D7CF364